MADMYQMIQLSNTYPGYSVGMGFENGEYVIEIMTPTGNKIIVGPWYNNNNSYQITIEEIENDISYQEWKTINSN